MKVGIVQGWLLAAAIAMIVGKYPPALCLGVAAAGMNASLWALTGNPRNGRVTSIPLCMLVIHYVALPAARAGQIATTDPIYKALAIGCSSSAVCAFSVLTILVGIIAAFASALRGDA